jgi:parallel beta-helix repeat protein
VIIAVFYGFNFFSVINPVINGENNQNTELNLPGPKLANYWVLDYIDINGNWSATNTTYAWCNGAGTLSDPYIIENVTINGQFVDTAFYVSNGPYFIIRNCTIYNAQGTSNSGGLRVLANNALIMNNTIYDNKGVGIYANGENITIVNNTVYNNNSTGIVTSINDKFFNVSGNIVYDNYYSGIQLAVSDNSSVYNNTAYNNGGDGITILGGEYNIISNNTLKENKLYGIGLVGGASNNTVINNFLYKNLKGCIWDQFPDKNNTIANNTCIPIDSSEKNGGPTDTDEPTIPLGHAYIFFTFLGIALAFIILKRNRYRIE